MPRIPALTLSGGKLSEFGGHKAAKEYRVWCHPAKGGDDYFYPFKTFAGAKNAYSRLASRKKSMGIIRVETPCAVVFDSRYHKYREVVIDKKA